MTELPPGFEKVNKNPQLDPNESFAELPKGFVKVEEITELPEGFVKKEDLTIDDLKRMKSSGVKLSDKQERRLWEEEENKPLLTKAGEAVEAFFPAAGEAAKNIALGAVELVDKGVFQPIGAMGGTPEEEQKAIEGAKNAVRSLAIGASKDIEETVNAAVRFGMFGSGFTDWAQGLSKEERFRRYQDREQMRALEAQDAELNPDRTNVLLAENPIFQNLAVAYAKMQGASPEEAEAARQGYKDLLLESGLTKDQISSHISDLGEFVSPVSIPGSNKLTGLIEKPVGKIVSKGGELTLRGIRPIASAVEKAATGTILATEKLQSGARKIGEYTINDPDTWIKGTVNTGILPIVSVAKPTAAVARVVKDITRQVDVGGAAGRMGMVQRAGRNGSNLTQQLFGPQGKGGVTRAKMADWAIRQTNAIVQPGVNGAALNAILGIPDIESGTDLGYSAGTGFGIGGLAGARIPERVGGVFDPTKSMAEKITNLVTPDPAQYRRDEDADLKRFLAQANPELQQQMIDLADIEKRKKAIDDKIANLTRERDAQINKEDALFKQQQIDGFQKQKAALEKSTPETQKEALRQVQLAFLDSLDLAQSSGKSAGLRGVNIAVLSPDNAEQFFANLYGDSLRQAQNTINLLTGIPSLTETDSQKLVEARQLLQRYATDVEGAKNARGFALQEDNTDPNSKDYVPPHLRRINQQGATAVINADIVKHLTSQGFNVRHTLQHEVQHAVQQFKEVQEMLSPLRGQLFDQKIQNEDGTTETYSEGIYSDEDLDRYATKYASQISPHDGGASFYEQFGGSKDKMRAYIKDEILAEIAAASGDYAGGTRASLDDVGRNVMDWLEVKTKSGVLKRAKEILRQDGIIFDNYGNYSTLLGAKITPETLAMVRQYQRGLKDFDGTMTVQQSRESDEPDIPLTKVLGSVALQNKYRHADFFEKEQIIRAKAADGSVTEIPVPKNAKIDPFIDVYRTQNGQLVDANGNVVTLGPEITFGTMPDGTTFEVDTRIARRSDGSPIILTNREMKSRALERTKMIRDAIDSAKTDASGVRLADTGNGNYRGVMSPAQIAAINALPNTVVSPNLKRMIKSFNDIMIKNDGTRVVMEYQAALMNGKYKAISPKIRDEVPIGFQLTKDGNFALTTISVSRLYDKMQAWADKKPFNLTLWNGDTGAFWDSVTKYLDNHATGQKGETGLHPDPYIAGRMKNRINDLFNAYNAETRESNPERSTLPRARGKDNLDIVIRSRRLDRINNVEESPSAKLPINYGYLTQNYMPEVNPMAAPLTAEEFQNRFDGSVTATRVRNAMATGKIDELESELRQMDELLPTESLQMTQGEDQLPRIQVVSMFDPNNTPSLETEEIPVDIDAEAEAELAILDAQDGTIPPQDIAKVLASKLDQLYADGGRSPIIPVLETELEKIYQQLESQAQEQEAATEDIVEAPETTEAEITSDPTAMMLQAVKDYDTGRVDNQNQTLAQHIRNAVGGEGNLKIPPEVTDQQIEAAARDISQYRASVRNRIQTGTKFENAVVAPAGLQYLPAFHASMEDFDKFNLDFVNTGNRLQVYGYGLYFAENKQEIDTFYPFQYQYKVDLDIDEDKILNWDSAIDSRLAKKAEELSYNIEAETLAPARIHTVKDYYKALSEYLGSEKDASMQLKEMGFDAIKYADRTSVQRGGEGDITYNYVIFDDAKIKILDKGNKALGPITQFMPAEDQSANIANALFDELLPDSPYPDAVQVGKYSPTYSREDFIEAYRNGEIEVDSLPTYVKRGVFEKTGTQLTTQFMPVVSEAPSGERGFQSKLQTEIQRKFRGAMATPEQLKAVINNPQNVKPEEVKWSGVIDEIDRLAAENNGKVPKDQLLQYLQNEGQVKFEEINLTKQKPQWSVSDQQNTEYFDTEEQAQEAKEEWVNNALDYIDIPQIYKIAETWSIGENPESSFLSKRYEIIDDMGSVVENFYNKEDAEEKLNKWKSKWFEEVPDSFRNGYSSYDYFLDQGFDTKEEALDSIKNRIREDVESEIEIREETEKADKTKYSSLQLPGGTNYREVVLAVPRKTLQPTDAEVKEYYGLLARKEDLIGNELNRYNELLGKIDASNKEVQNDVYYSSHFKDIPNYVAHMRLNERTDAEGNPGLFVEEFQSDRHQKARETGYISDQEAKLNEAKKEYEKLAIQNVRGKLNDQEKSRLNELRQIVSGQGSTVKGIPDAPFRKDWGVQLFKRALRDAVESGKKWIGWTTGIEQVKRYEDAMRKSVDSIHWNDNGNSHSVFAVKNGKQVFSEEFDLDGISKREIQGEIQTLDDVVGQEIASQILKGTGKAENKNQAIWEGNDLTIGGEGMKGFYDQILPKEIGRYVSKMGGKVEKSGIETDKRRTFDDDDVARENGFTLDEFYNLPQSEQDALTRIYPKETTPIWRVNITPEMKNVVRAGQMQFMPAIQTIPERFTGTGEEGEQRRGRYVAPPEFWTRFDIDEFERGGKFFDIETGEDVTNKTYATGTIDVTGKRPSLVSDSIIEDIPDSKGRTWKTNLFRKSAGWEWISENPPEIAAIGSKEKPNPVLISVENNPDHFYSLKVDFPNGVKLARYPEGGEPRLRPTKKGQLQFGNEVGRIKTSSGKEHPVYDSITIGTQFMPAESSSQPLSDVTIPEGQQQEEKPLQMVALPKKPTPVEKTMQADAGDFSIVIGGKPGKYGFSYTTIADLAPTLELSQDRKKYLIGALTPRNDELNKKRDALLEVGNLYWENIDIKNKEDKSQDDIQRSEEITDLLNEFMENPDRDFTLNDAAQVAEVDRLTRSINLMNRGMVPAPFKFPVDNREVPVPVEKPADIPQDASKEDKAKYAKDLAAYESYVDLVNKQEQDANVGLKSLQSSVATLFKTKKFKEFISDAVGLSNIDFDNILGTWKFDPEPSFVFSSPGMTWTQAQEITKWMSVLMTQDAGIAWKPSIGLTKGAPSVYLIHDKKLTEEQIFNALKKAKEVGIDGLSVTVDGKGIKAANFDNIDKFEDKLIKIQKAANIKFSHNTLVDSFYYDTTSDFTADDGTLRVPDWLKGQINEKNIQDQQGGVGQTMREGRDNSATRGFTILLRRGIDSVLIPYAKALAGEGFTFDPDRFAERYGLGQKVADYIREQLYPTTGLSRSVTPILDGTEKFTVPESYYTKGGRLKTSVNDLMYALQKRSSDDGFIQPGDYSTRAGQIIAETIVDEIAGHMERASKNPEAPNAIGWYDTALKKMKQKYSRFFSFLNRGTATYDADKEFIFDAVLGITSQGNNVFENGKMAARVQFFLESGKTLPEIKDILYGTFGGETRAIENNLLKLDELIKNNGIQTLDKLFRKKKTVSEWNGYFKKNKNLWFKGKPLTVDGQADQMVTGFSVFGPKIGSFINNLHGDYSTLTADLWYTRTWNRILGNVFQHAPLKEANQYDTFRKAILEQYRSDSANSAGEKFEPLLKRINKDGEKEFFDYMTEPELDGISRDGLDKLLADPEKMLELATELEDRYRKGQYKAKSDLRRAAKNWIENRTDPVAAPRTDLERDFQQNVMEIAQKKLRRKGIDITIADMQAALWYNEKELFGLYGAQVSGSEPADYADAADNVEEIMSYASLFKVNRLVDVDGKKRTEIVRILTPEEEVALTGVKNAKTPEEYVALLAARKKAEDDKNALEKKQEEATLKVAKFERELTSATDENLKQKLQKSLERAKKNLSELTGSVKE